MRRLLGLLLMTAAGCFFGELSLLPEGGGGGGQGGVGGGSGGAGGTGGELPSIDCEEVLVPPSWPTTCGACIAATECCTAAEACASDEACAAMLACTDEHYGPHSGQLCGYEHPLASSRITELFLCLDSACREACVRGNWGCNEDHSWPEPIADDGIVELYSIALDLGYVPDGTARACDDSVFGDCDSPVAEVTSTPGVGVIYFDLPFTFGGYFTLESAAFYPLRIYPWPQWRSSRIETPLLSIAGLADLAAEVGEPIEPGMGRLLVRVHDCIDAPGIGVSFELTSNGIVTPPTPYYFGGKGPLPGATATTDEAYVLWLNVPPGATTITGVLEGTGETVVQNAVRIDADGQSVLFAYPKTTP